MEFFRYTTLWGRVVYFADETEWGRRYGVVSGYDLFCRAVKMLIDKGEVEEMTLYPN